MLRFKHAPRCKGPISRRYRWTRIGVAWLSLTTAVLVFQGVSVAAVQKQADRATLFFEGGLTAYRSSEYHLAAELFGDSAKAKLTTGALRNLGNAEWHRGNAGPAIVAWERALWLNPFDRVAKQNLAFARRTAQVDAPDLKWHEAASLYLPTSWWAWLAGLCLWIAIGAAVLPGILRIRKAAWHQALAAFGLAAFLLTIPAHFGIMSRAKTGFIMERETPLRLTPTSHGQVVTRLTAGDPVRMEKRAGDFLFVRTLRATGWIHAGDAGWVCPPEQP
jgi:hypothetical protein